MESVGPLLETWNTLNVYCEVFQLDSFTFDDFLEAMRFSSDDINCELFTEIHCAVLKILVNSEKDQEGAIQISLPAAPEEDSEESEESEPEPEPEPEPVPTRRTTRSSLARVEINNTKPPPRSRSTTADIKVHRAAEMFTEYGWIDRNYLEECSNQMTEFRKEKIELQRARKATLEELRKLHEERKELEPERPPSPAPEPEEIAESKVPGTEEESEATSESDEEEESYIGRSLRGGADRELERKRRQEEERLRKELAAKLPKGTKQYQRVLKKIEDLKAKVKAYEADIAVLDNDLREADCPRTRVLGKDRFWNRYYWFERNGMPYEGLPNSSTASAGYANGRIWVQGPDEIEREGFIDLPDELNRSYFKSLEWGYYEDPDELDELSIGSIVEESARLNCAKASSFTGITSPRQAAGQTGYAVQFLGAAGFCQRDIPK
ncbi:DDT domain-containing protein [Coccidioides immitis H538.4]|uniref:DDT domain-containing protein n=1 Tax=Coccidioides immitis H538.4 TaxID=396776 RepID=A0A0J8RM05_COCIT|nr:DDT domain-containing protein [Coccidioides immitis H538.4]